MNGLSVAVLMLAGVAFYVAVSHFLFFMRVRDRMEMLAFSLACFSIGFYDLFCAGLYSAESVLEGTYWQNAQSISLMILGGAVIWFTSEFTGSKSRKWDNVFYIYIILQVVLLVYDKCLVFSVEPSVKAFELFGFLHVTYNEGTPKPLFFVQNAIGFVIGVYVLCKLYKYAKSGNLAETKPILLGMSCLLLGVVNDVAVGSGLYNGMYLIEYAFMGLVIGMATSLDTVHIQTASALKMSREELVRLAAAVNSAAESIIITDSRGVIQYVNPWFERMTGFSRDEVVGKNTRVLSSGKNPDSLYSNLWSTISQGCVWRGHFINKKKDGSLFEEEVVISPVENAEGKVINFVAVKRDVTQERALEHQIRQSQKMSAIGHLAHKVTHEFTNVLLVIMGNAQLAKKQTADMPKVDHNLDQILTASQRISSLTAELLAFAHPAPPEKRQVKFSKILSGVEKLLKPSIGVDATLEMEHYVGVCKVNIDISQIEQVIVHLAINAVQAMPKGGLLRVQSSLADLSDSEKERLQAGTPFEILHRGDFALLQVSDEGIGMTEEVKARIFEPFFSKKDSSSHPGLGLSTIYAIIEQHGGYIDVESDAGKGSVFKVYLPIGTD